MGCGERTVIVHKVPKVGSKPEPHWQSWLKPVGHKTKRHKHDGGTYKEKEEDEMGGSEVREGEWSE